MRLRAFILVGLTAVLALAPAAGASAAPAGTAASCPGTFQVLHNDRVGALQLPAGPYRITTTGSLSCTRAATLFAAFLQDWDGRLSGGWRVNAARSGFVQGNGPLGFSVRPAGGGGGSNCAGAYTVLRTQRIQTPQTTFLVQSGNYRITLVGSGLSCIQAAAALTQFLDRGALVSPWTQDPVTTIFRRGANGPGFMITRVGASTGGGGRHPAAGTLCPGTFRVLHNDRIGALVLPAGPYYLTILRGGGLSCTQAASLLRVFLQRPDGLLPSPWVLNATYARFNRGRTSPVGFQIEPA